MLSQDFEQPYNLDYNYNLPSAYGSTLSKNYVPQSVQRVGGVKIDMSIEEELQRRKEIRNKVGSEKESVKPSPLYSNASNHAPFTYETVGTKDPYDFMANLGNNGEHPQPKRKQESRLSAAGKRVLTND